MMRNWQRAAALAVVCGAILAGPGGRAEAAFLVGTTVTSPGIAFRGSTTGNAFDNAAAVIADPGIEFTYQDAPNTDTFDFADGAVRVTDVTNPGAVADTFAASFTDPAFLGATVSAASGGFAGLTAAINGSTLTITSTQAITVAQVRSAVLTIAPAPAVAVAAPSSLTLSGIAGLGGGAIAVARRPRRGAAAA